MSKGGGKTEHYGKVHANNISGKLCNESAAHKKLIEKNARGYRMRPQRAGNVLKHVKPYR
jgi:hypothetical protein